MAKTKNQPQNDIDSDDIETPIDENNLDALATEREPGEPPAPHKLTDSELREHQDSMQKLYNTMCEINDQAEQSGDPEMEQKWDRAHAEFQQHERAVWAHRLWRERSDSRKQRMEQLADSAGRMPKDVRNRLRGAGMDPSAYDADETFEHLHQHNRRICGAVRAWWKNQIGNPSSITDDEMQDARTLGFHPGDSNLWLPLLNQPAFEQLRESFDAAMDGLKPGGRNWKRGRNAAKRDIMNALSTQTGGGAQFSENYLFGTTFIQMLEEAVLAYSGLIQNVDVIRTENGAALYWPTMDDTSNEGEMLDEATANPAAGGATASDADPSFGRMVLYSFIGSSKHIPVSNSLLEDNQVGLEQRLPEALGVRLGRLKNKKGTVGSGTGSDEPDGIVPQSAAGDTAAGANAIAFDELFNLEHAVDPAIREANDCKYMFHDSTLKALRKLKDDNGRYLWTVDTRSDMPDMINGHDYIVNQNMAQIGTANKSVIFGNLMAYKWRDVVGSVADRQGIRLVILRELFALSDQTGFQAFCRFDGRLLNAGDDPVVHLVHP